MITLIVTIWERLGWMITGLVIGWVVARIWSHRVGWARELDSDHGWIRTWTVVGSLVPILQMWSLLAIPVLIYSAKDAESKAEREHRRNIERMAYNKWWRETEFRWERKWERVPRRGANR